MRKLVSILTLTAILQATLLVTLNVQANNDIVIFNDIIEHSQCTNTNGTPVYTSYEHKPIENKSEYATAWKTYREITRYYIHLNYDFFNPAPSNVKEWVWYHECGHHRLGHTVNAKQHASSTASIIKAEGDADCFATSEFRKHHQESELALTLDWMNKSEMGISSLRIRRIKACK